MNSDLCVHFRWRPAGQVRLDAGGRLLFPALPAVPGTYRMRLVSTGGASTYIGEGSDLKKRAALYRGGAAGQKTNFRMNARMREHLGQGGQIELSILTEAEITLGPVRKPLDLRRKASRLLVEAAALHLVPDAEPLENLPGIGDRSDG